MDEDWDRYVAQARALDDVRSAEHARTEGIRQGVAQMSEHAAHLEGRVSEQAAGLTTLARALRVRRVKLSPLAPEQNGRRGLAVRALGGRAAAAVTTPDDDLDPAVELSRAAADIDTAERLAGEADVRGHRATLLPTATPRARALVVYLVSALAVLAAQAVVFWRDGTEANPLLVLFAIPLAGWLVGRVVLALGGRTRTATERPPSYARTGLVICFLIGPLALLAVVLTSVV